MNNYKYCNSVRSVFDKETIVKLGGLTDLKNLKHLALTISLVLSLCISAKGIAQENTGDTATKEHPRPLFKDKTETLGLNFHNSAAAWADFDNDGSVDLYVSCTIWQNNQGKRFTRIDTDAEGPAILANFNNNGFDIFAYSELKLLVNVYGT